MERAAMEELKRITAGGTRVRIDMSPSEGLMLVNLIQVASSNTGCDGPDSIFGQRLVETVGSFFGARTAIGDLIRSGWTVAK